jgi:formylmethanofuran dehydrogenase subunit B
MNEPTAADWISAVGSLLGGIAALAAVGIAADQLKKLVTQLKQGSFAALLTLEIEMNNRKQKVEDASREVRRLSEEERSADEIMIAYEYLEGCMENWLNLADRLAFCIRNPCLQSAACIGMKACQP